MLASAKYMKDVLLGGCDVMITHKGKETGQVHGAHVSVVVAMTSMSAPGDSCR